MGAVAAFFVHRAAQAPPEWRALVATGFLGGLTTFSAFSLDVAQLLGQGLVARAVLYFAATLLLAFLGFYLGTGITKLAFS
jgi:CrcB protein